MCISSEKDEDLVLDLEKETKFKIGKLGSGKRGHPTTLKNTLGGVTLGKQASADS